MAGSRPQLSRLLLACACALGLLAATAVSAQAAFPGIPGKIVFKSFPGPSFDAEIYVADSNGANPVQLTDNDFSDGEPSFSPDGTQIVFRSDRGGASNDIWLMNADGGNQHQLTFTDTSNERDPTFSPDGQQIILERNAGGPSEEIVLMNADGSGAHVIGPPGQDPQFSPDGKLIVFSSNFGGTPVNEIWVMNADGTNAHALTSSASGQQNTEPSFSPDSRTIAWDRLDPSSWEIWAMNADGSGQRQLTNDDFEADTPAFAPDGAHLIWDQDNGMGDDNIALMAATGGPISFLTQIANEAVDPDWQPIPVVCDGRRATLVGTAGADNLLGTSAADVIAGLEGKDTITGLQGKDRVCGGPGKDILKGGSGNDRLFGQAGKDKLKAGKGKKDRCVGGKGKDKAEGCERLKSI